MVGRGKQLKSRVTKRSLTHSPLTIPCHTPLQNITISVTPVTPSSLSLSFSLSFHRGFRRTVDTVDTMVVRAMAFRGLQRVLFTKRPRLGRQLRHRCSFLRDTPTTQPSPFFLRFLSRDSITMYTSHRYSQCCVLWRTFAWFYALRLALAIQDPASQTQTQLAYHNAPFGTRDKPGGGATPTSQNTTDL